MKVIISEIGKRFNREWIFRNINKAIDKGSVCAITGPNGSGKSTLLKLIAQGELPSEGKIIYYDAQDKGINADKAYQFISFAAPYVDLPEQLTLSEFFHFHQKFKPLRNDISFKKFTKLVFLEEAARKQIWNFSSGMKQRLKLGISILSQSPILILDEPSSNLDEQGIDLYNKLLAENTRDRITFIGSNEAEKELLLAKEGIEMSNYKKIN